MTKEEAEKIEWGEVRPEELEKVIPELEKALAKLEEAKKFSPGFWDMRINV